MRLACGRDRRIERAANIGTSWNSVTRQEFETALRNLMNDPSTQIVIGSFRSMPAVHYFNAETGIDVFFHEDGRLWSAFPLSEDQIINLTTTGNVQ